MRTAILSGVVLLLLVCGATPTKAGALVALSDSDKASLAGEWRANPGKPGGACGADAGNGDVRMVVEFALTGGTISLDDGSEGGGRYEVLSATAAKDRFSFGLKETGALAFAREPGGLLKAASASDLPIELGGLVFKRCRAPADRSAIRLTKPQIAAVSSAMESSNFVFVDARAKAGCKALDYQYVFFDLVGPLEFTVGRWNSAHLAERLADGKKSSLPIDEVSNWTVDKAEALANGYRFTITERIPPNGSRGDTTTVRLLPTKNGMASIPEWKRTYRRCASRDLAAE
jgi:hypothetical protein